MIRYTLLLIIIHTALCKEFSKCANINRRNDVYGIQKRLKCPKSEDNEWMHLHGGVFKELRRIEFAKGDIFLADSRLFPQLHVLVGDNITWRRDIYVNEELCSVKKLQTTTKSISTRTISRTMITPSSTTISCTTSTSPPITHAATQHDELPSWFKDLKEETAAILSLTLITVLITICYIAIKLLRRRLLPCIICCRGVPDRVRENDIEMGSMSGQEDETSADDRSQTTVKKRGIVLVSDTSTQTLTSDMESSGTTLIPPTDVSLTVSSLSTIGSSDTSVEGQTPPRTSPMSSTPIQNADTSRTELLSDERERIGVTTRSMTKKKLFK